MAETTFLFPYTYIQDPASGRPVALGNVYFGIEDLDPTVEANRIPVTLLQENGTRVVIQPASQPLQTNEGGGIQYAGSPVQVLVDGVFSLTVLDSQLAQKYYSPKTNVVADISTEGPVPVNGSFENDTQTAGQPDNWSIVETANGTIQTSSDSVHGLRSLAFVSTDTLGAGAATSDKFDVHKSSSYSLTFSYKSTAATTLNKIDINWYSSADALISTSSILNDGTTNPTVFTAFTVEATSPATAVRGEIVITGMEGTGTTFSGTTYFDNLLLESNLPVLINKTLKAATIDSATYLGTQTGFAGDVTGNLTGDVLADNGTLVLQNGTNGTDSTYIGDVTGDLTGNADTASVAALAYSIADNTVNFSNKIIKNGAFTTTPLAAGAIALVPVGSWNITSTGTGVDLELQVASGVWIVANVFSATSSSNTVSDGINVRLNNTTGLPATIQYCKLFD